MSADNASPAGDVIAQKLRELRQVEQELAELTHGDPVVASALGLAHVLCGAGELEQRDRAVGSRQRRVRWMANGNLIAPDWRGVRRPPGAS